MAPNSDQTPQQEQKEQSPTSSPTLTPQPVDSQVAPSLKGKEPSPPEEGVKELPAIKAPKATKKAKAPEEWKPTITKDNPNHITIK